MEQMNSNEILYQSQNITLLKEFDELYFIENNTKYHLTSHPYEPCLYVNLDNKIVRIIHNSFTTSELIDVAKSEHKLNAISGNEYDIKAICELLSFAINLDIYEENLSYYELQLKKQKQADNKAIFNKTQDDADSQKEKNHSFEEKYKMIELTDDLFYKEFQKYDECVLDYCILKIDAKYNSIESHKSAVVFAMDKWKNYLNDEYDMEIEYNPQKMKASKIEANDFFTISSNDKENNKSYYNLFLHPPYGCSYNKNDFIYINELLFPNGYNALEIYNWSTDWSNYFDDGLEWWGAKCISIYDKSLNRFVVIGASATD